MTMFQGAVLVALMSGVTQVQSECSTPDIPTGIGTVTKADNARQDGWSGANCGSNQHDVATGTTCKITAADGFFCTNPGKCKSDGSFESTGSCKKICKTPGVPEITSGAASWTGANCGSGAKNVLSGTTCTITAAASHVCISPGLCTDGTFENTAECKEKAKCNIAAAPYTAGNCPGTGELAANQATYCTGVAVTGTTVPAQTCGNSDANDALCCKVKSKCGQKTDGTNGGAVSCPTGTVRKTNSDATLCIEHDCGGTLKADSKDTATCCQVTSTCSKKGCTNLDAGTCTEDIVTCDRTKGFVYNPSAKNTKCTVAGCPSSTATSADTGTCCQVESSCSQKTNGISGDQASCQQCIGADGKWVPCDNTYKERNGFENKNSADDTKCQVAGCPITSASSADVGTCCQESCSKKNSDGKDTITQKCPTGAGVKGRKCATNKCQYDASGILTGVDIANCCQAECPDKCPSNKAWLGSKDANGKYSGPQCATNTCQLSGGKLVGADKTTCCKAKCPKGGCAGLLDAANKALVDRATGAYCATAQCDWSSSDKNDKTRCCQEKTTVCSPSDTIAISGSACKCATTSTTNECAVAKYCWADNTCNSAAKAACSVVDGSAKSSDYPCVCGTESCTTNQKCTSASASNSCAMADCSSLIGAVSSVYPCTCGNAKCTANQKCTSSSGTCELAVCSSVVGAVSSVYPCKCGTATCTDNQKCTKDAVGSTPANDCTLAACSSWHFKKQCKCGTATCGTNEECFPISNTCALVSGDDSCFHNKDGVCDEPTYCTAGTDCSDCGTCKVVTETTAPAIAGDVTLEVKTNSGFEADAGLKIWAGTDEETLVLAGTTVRGLLVLKTPLKNSYAQGTTVYRIEVSKVDASVRAASAEVDAANAKANSTNSTNNKRAMLFAHRSAEPAFLFAAMVIAIGYAGL